MEVITSKQLARLVVNKAKQDESDWNVLPELVAKNKRSYALQQGPAGSDPEGLNIDEYAPITSPRTWGIVRFYLIRSHAIHGEGRRTTTSLKRWPGPMCAGPVPTRS